MLQHALYLALIVLTIAHPALFDRETAFSCLTVLLAVLFAAACIQRAEWSSLKRLSRPVQCGAVLYLPSGILSVFAQPAWNMTPLFFSLHNSCS